MRREKSSKQMKCHIVMRLQICEKKKQWTHVSRWSIFRVKYIGSEWYILFQDLFNKNTNKKEIYEMSACIVLRENIAKTTNWIKILWTLFFFQNLSQIFSYSNHWVLKFSVKNLYWCQIYINSSVCKC